MDLSAETLKWLDECFARAVRYFRQKGLSEADAEDATRPECLRQRLHRARERLKRLLE